MLRKQITLIGFFWFLFGSINAQTLSDTTIVPEKDTVLRITNLNPFFTVHVDSMLSYQLAINKDQKDYYWYLKNSPVGLKINKDNGLLTFKAEKSYFLTDKLKYDREYSVSMGVQSLSDPDEKIDTSFTLFSITRKLFCQN